MTTTADLCLLFKSRGCPGTRSRQENKQKQKKKKCKAHNTPFTFFFPPGHSGRHTHTHARIYCTHIHTHTLTSSLSAYVPYNCQTWKMHRIRQDSLHRFKVWYVSIKSSMTLQFFLPPFSLWPPRTLSPPPAPRSPALDL